MGAGIIGTTPPGTAGTSPATAHTARRRAWLRWSMLAFALLAVATAAGGAIWAAHYQPVTGQGGGHVNGKIVTRQINNYELQGQTFVVPQAPHRGWVNAWVMNTGHFPVTVLSASLYPPGPQDPQARLTQPLRDSGTPTYWPGTGPASSGPGLPLAGLVLHPGEEVLVRLPVVTAGCWAGREGLLLYSQFSLTVRFLAWTHQLSISWTDPSAPDQGAIAARQAAAGTNCPR
jgi:hypothetical protein